MEIRPKSRYVLQGFLYYLGVSIIVYFVAYAFLVLPFASGSNPSDVNLLKTISIGVGCVAFILSISVQIQNALRIKREYIRLNNDNLEVTTGAISLSTTNIPLSQIEYANTLSTFFDTIFQTTTITIGSDTVSVDISGFDRKEALAFAEKISASQKLRVKTS